MLLSTAYRRRSDVRPVPGGLAIALSPNLRRDRVAFDGRLKDPLPFREAISALHDIVISDLRYVPKDKSALEEHQKRIAEREAAIRQGAATARREELRAESLDPMPEGLEAEHRIARDKYWRARQRYSDHLIRNDQSLWRKLMPCDPVITVAEDALLFECFSADESSYGCLTASRDLFDDVTDVAPGTTNVDYSWNLYDHFQGLRSYRQTRFQLDPTGFEVATNETLLDAPLENSAYQAFGGQHREEKIDLPATWLRGFMQLQSAMVMPMKRVRVDRSGVYNLLGFLTRSRAKKSPRAIRFQMEPGKVPQMVLEPWEQVISTGRAPYQGVADVIRIWGRDRLQVLRRLLPLIDYVDVYLIGTGMPSFWVAHMGDLQLVLGLSGWTTNDWSGASAISQLMPPVHVTENELVEIAAAFRADASMAFERLAGGLSMPRPKIAAGLNTLAHLGQVIHDLPAQTYRWRQVMPEPVTSEQFGPEDPETAAAHEIEKSGRAKATRDETLPSGLRLIEGKADRDGLEILLDGDGRILKAKCSCSHHFKYGLRKGPCRHLQALRNKVISTSTQPATLERWYQQYWN
jgi:hypothetical protein